LLYILIKLFFLVLEGVPGVLNIDLRVGDILVYLPAVKYRYIKGKAYAVTYIIVELVAECIIIKRGARVYCQVGIPGVERMTLVSR